MMTYGPTTDQRTIDDVIDGLTYAMEGEQEWLDTDEVRRMADAALSWLISHDLLRESDQ